MLDLASRFWVWKHKNKKYMKYRWKAYMGLAGSMRNNGKDCAAGDVFIQSYESGIQSKKVDTHHMKIQFNDGTEFTLWIANKMYAYGSGTYKSADGQLNYIKGLLPKWVNLIALEIEQS